MKRLFFVTTNLAVSFIVLVGVKSVVAEEFHVSPVGTLAGDGSREHPWDLTSALAHPTAVTPGDTIWLHGGKYKGSFQSKLKGREDARIVVRQIPHERAVIELVAHPQLGTTFLCYGAWTRFQDFEVTCTNPQRRTKIAGSWPSDLQRGSIQCRGSHLQFVNLLVHDLGSGFGCWSEAEGGEIYGCMIYNNGWGGPDRGHGHGIYAQNKESIKIIKDNMIFQQFGFGVHVYGSGNAFLKGFQISGNAVFHNGCLQKPGGQTTGILVGGGAPLEDVFVEDNMVYNGGLQIGSSSTAKNKDVTVRNNYVTGLRLFYQDRLVFEENTVIGGWPVLTVYQNEGDSLENHKINRNVYYNTQPKHYLFSLLLGKERNALFLKEWQKRGFDANAQVHDGHPRGVNVFIRPNLYEPGRANVVVFNWDRKPEVSVNLKDVLKKGQKFRIVSARNFHGPAVVSGLFNGEEVLLPMRHVAPAQPVGMPEYELPEMEPNFGGYVVLAE